MAKGDGTETCGKVSYETRSLAKDGLKGIVRNHGQRGLKVYRCDRCGLWHIGRGRRARNWRKAKENGGAAVRLHRDFIREE